MDNLEFNKNNLPGVLSTQTGKPIEGPLEDHRTEIVYFRVVEKNFKNIGFTREVLEDKTFEQLSSHLQNNDLKILFQNSSKDLLVTSGGIKVWN